MRFEFSVASAVAVTVISYFTYFRGYDQPPFFFWDENYHVAHAQKYLNGVFFMEPHPPLGKLLIAAGEYILNYNLHDNQFIGTDHAASTPPGFSFAGYRFFPALFGWLTAPLLFYVILLVSRNAMIALLCSLLYVFDNALIVHARGAMLEGTQLFFVVLCLAAFLSSQRYRSNMLLLRLSSIVFGASFAAVLTTKINGLILIILVPALAFWFKSSKKLWLNWASFAAASFLLVFIFVWQLHFTLGKTVQRSLPDFGYYQASPKLKQIIDSGLTSQWRHFPLMLGDALRFVPHYQKGVPELNLCNQNENGSPAWLWPLGGRSINYRWNRDGDFTRYLFLQVNPVVWGLALLGVVGTLALGITGILRPLKRKLKRAALLWTFLSMYLGYMLVMLQLKRVMYLYHYFIPLIFSFILFAIFVKELTHIGNLRIKSGWKLVTLSIAIVFVISTYSYFSPLTYAKPLTREQTEARAWLSIWDLRCPDCPLTNKFARSTCDPKIKQFPQVTLGSLRAEVARQDWGEPKSNAAMESEKLQIGGQTYEKGIGTHANSNIRFKLNGAYTELSGLAGIPDYIAEKPGTPASVAFEILGDGRSLWKSKVVHSKEAPVSFSVSVKSVESLELVTGDGGDGINNDHACWLNLELK